MAASERERRTSVARSKKDHRVGDAEGEERSQLAPVMRLVVEEMDERRRKGMPDSAPEYVILRLLGRSMG
jgi:hypothetical protein